MIEPTKFGQELLDLIAVPTPAGSVVVWPLGQSGLALRFPSAIVFIDPYLSNYCEGALSRPFDHRRMTRAPLDGAEITIADVVICSHDHLDHLDLPTIRSLADASPQATIVVPLSAVEVVVGLGWRRDRVIGTRAGDAVQIAGLVITAFAVPHDNYDEDLDLGHPYQGYVVSGGGVAVAHTGDSRSDDELASTLERLDPDLICLPINGRDAARAAMGFAGNMSAEEAVELALQAGISRVLPMHDDMFVQNIDVDARVRFTAAIYAQPTLTMIRPRVGESALIWADEAIHRNDDQEERP